MIKKNLVITTIIAAMLSQCFLFADDSSLKLDTVKEKVISKSLQLRALENSLTQLQKNAKDTGKTISSANDMLEMDDKLSNLRGLPVRTPSEEIEYQMLMRILGKDGLTTDQRFQYTLMRDTTDLNMQYSLQASTHSIDITKNSLVQAVSEQYAGLLKLRDNITLQQKLKKNLDADLKNAQEKYRLKKISKTDLRLLELQVTLAGVQLNKVQRSFESAVVSLNRTIGEPITKRYATYSTDGIVVSTQMDAYENYLAKALASRADIIDAEVYQRAKAKEFEVTKNSYPFESSTNYKSAAYALDDANYKLDLAKMNVEQEIISDFQALNGKIQAVESTDLLYQTAKKTYDEAVKKTRMGLMNEKQLSDADISQTQAAMKLQNARYDLWIYQIKMENACGVGPGISGIGR